MATATRVRDSFCSFCGTKYDEPLAYPRTCGGCKTMVWANPIPVAVVLVQVRDGDRVGLLVVRRAIQPQLGKLGIVGGFVEEHESWQDGAAREVREETGLVIDPSKIEPMYYASSSPRPNRILMFSVSPEIPVTSLPPFTPSSETSERGLVFGPDGLEEVFAFSLHVEAAKRYFAAHGITGPHDFVAR
jgi:ADP-ribose pyrophosphatase YjhB (NUDIX family)